jgi:predicted CoA-substrate-specific enzyme activase
MLFAGVDIGSTTIKVVLLDEREVRQTLVVPSGDLPAKTAFATYCDALAREGVSESAVASIATTGYGRRLVDFGDMVMTEIKACAAGALYHATATSPIRTIVDVGGQDTKVIAVDDAGEVEDFSMNDKCAAGTGRFLEMLATKLRLTYEQFVSEALASETMIQMNATCAVFAESEVVGMLARNVSKSDIASSAHNAIASRIASMSRRVGQRGGFCFVGGGARNGALVRALEQTINQTVHVPKNAQSIVALGAALGARKKHSTGTYPKE